MDHFYTECYNIQTPGSSLTVEYAHGVRVAGVQFSAPRLYMQNIEEFKNEFDPYLEAFLNEKISDFNTLTTDNFIKDFVSYSKQLMVGGKRLRPYLAYLMYKAYGGNREKTAMKLFVSLEIFHLFALVHDDIMDKASTRRGEKTVHKYIENKITGFGNLNHVANSQAILTGDLLVTWALENFKNQDFENDNFEVARKYFYKMIDEVILGQMLDVDIATKEIADKNLIDEKTRLKTSRYTCVRPMQIGAVLASIDYKDEEFLEQLGTEVGIAFQMQDDLLAIVGNGNVLNKDVLIDIEEHQHTFFTNYLFENGNSNVIEEFKKYFGKKLTNSEKTAVIKLLTDSGAIEAGREKILKMLFDAKILIDDSNFDDQTKKLMSELVDMMKKRQA